MKIVIQVGTFCPSETYTLDRKIDIIGGGFQVEVMKVISEDILFLRGGRTFATPCSEFFENGPSTSGVMRRYRLWIS